MSEPLRKCLSEVLVNAHKAFYLIPWETNRPERQKINKVDRIVNEIANTLGLDAEREVQELCRIEVDAQFQIIDDECMLIWRESDIEDEDYLIDMERIILGGGLP